MRLRIESLLISLMLFSASGVSVWAAFVFDVGLVISVIGAFINICLGIGYVMSPKRTRRLIAARYLLTLVWAAFLGFRALPFAFYEVIIAFLFLGFTLTKPQRWKVFVTVLLYLVILAFSIPIFLQSGWDLAVLQQNQKAESAEFYRLGLQKVPWKKLNYEQAEILFGTPVADADYRLIRTDGSAFALFFSLEALVPQLSEEMIVHLEDEIKDKWLTDLVDWEDFRAVNGFILTAKGSVEDNTVGYVVFYRHLVKGGVWAVFWSRWNDRDRLFEEAAQIYNQLRDQVS